MKQLPAGFFILLLAACGSPAPALPTVDLPALLPPTPTPVPALKEEATPDFAAPVCVNPAPTQADIDRALAFPGGIFDGGDWERTYTVASDKVVVMWYSESIPAIVTLESLTFPCGYEDLDLDSYFNDEGWSIIFENYQGYEYVNECRNDEGLRLYRFTAMDQGFAYNVRYWALSDTPTRVISFMVVMPAEAESRMDETAYALFPQLQSCER